ncbi:hypothetical protein C8R45DRAFT_1025481 [Mycena sanguinolenta]|nr:hypothetical protein C8R45DRAFT_1025481 [Mycena sanguinolenta]
MSSPQKSDYGVGEDSTLHKAKQKFLEHLETVDTSDGLTNTLVLKFRLTPEIEAELNAFVVENGCFMESRVLSREEQDKIDKRQKNCAQYTWFQVPPEAQEKYLKNRKVSISPGKKATPKKVAPPAKTPSAAKKTPSTKLAKPSTSTPAKSARKTSKQKRDTPESEEEDGAVPETDDVVSIPTGKFDDLCGRLASAMLLLPTVDPARGAECRDMLLEVAHEMRQLRPLKRALHDEDGAGKGEKSAKKRRT